MCGISGIVYNKTSKQTEKFKECANTQSHRGPDYIGYYSDNNVELIHHRLSIIDLNSRSHQPFYNNKKNNILVYNGEIYNFLNIKEKFNFITNTTSDTEVLYHFLNHTEFNPKLINGIFAFAFYNKENNKLELFRDRLGVKPLYYYKDDNKFIFASEAKVIYNFLDKLEINHQVLSEFLVFGHSNSDNTLVNGVMKLTPGTSLTLDINNFCIHQKEFWSQESLVSNQIKPLYNEAKSKALNLIHSAVRRQCISDVAIGAYLSGGIDSSAIVCLASKYCSQPLLTYSVNFDNSSKSELLASRKVAKHCKTEHFEFEVQTKKADEFISKLVYQYDEPFADPAMIPLYLIAQKASKDVKVVLQGDGGDEIFAGYGRHLDLKNYQLRKNTFKILKNFGITSNIRASYNNRYKKLKAINNAELMAGLVERDAFVDLKPYFLDNLNFTQPLLGYYKSDNKYSNLPLVQNMLYTDMENILRHKYLEKVDKVNMFHSIEARVPLLDNELVEYVMRLPSQYKIKKGTTKYFLRDILCGIVPNDILNANKQSFGTPFPDWTNKRLYLFAKHQFEIAKKWKTKINYDLLLEQINYLHYNKIPKKNKMAWKFLVLTLWLSYYKHKTFDI